MALQEPIKMEEITAIKASASRDRDDLAPLGKNPVLKVCHLLPIRNRLSEGRH
jgi:hypothetical protein